MERESDKEREVETAREKEEIRVRLKDVKDSRPVGDERNNQCPKAEARERDREKGRVEEGRVERVEITTP